MGDREKYLLAASFGAVILGMIGLSGEVPYSGWVLAAGVIGLFNVLC